MVVWCAWYARELDQFIDQYSSCGCRVLRRVVVTPGAVLELIRELASIPVILLGRIICYARNQFNESSEWS